MIDFNQKLFLDEVIGFNIILPGAFSYSDLAEMYFDDYERIRELVEKIGKKKING